MSDLKISFSREVLYHLSCGACRKWWSIGDWQQSSQMFCPYCGEYLEVQEIQPKEASNGNS